MLATLKQVEFIIGTRLEHKQNSSIWEENVKDHKRNVVFGGALRCIDSDIGFNYKATDLNKSLSDNYRHYINYKTHT